MAKLYFQMKHRLETMVLESKPVDVKHTLPLVCDGDQKQISALIYFPYRVYLGAAGQYAVCNQNDFWRDVTEENWDDLVDLGSNVLVKSRDSDGSLRVDKGIILVLSTNVEQLNDILKEKVEHTLKNEKQESPLLNNDGNNNETQSPPIKSDVCHATADEVKNVKLDDIRELSLAERIVQYRASDNVIKQNIQKLQKRMSTTQATSSKEPSISKSIPDSLSTHSTNSEETLDNKMTIGPGDTKILKSTYKSIDWENYKSATRKLLMILFPVAILATHSLTGKPSPAFKGRERKPKQKLDSTIVSDIVYIVSKNCNVRPNLVRHCITIKCSDETKMQRLRNGHPIGKKSYKRKGKR